jgi:hypothetical protein
MVPHTNEKWKTEMFRTLSLLLKGSGIIKNIDMQIKHYKLNALNEITYWKPRQHCERNSCCWLRLSGKT